MMNSENGSKGAVTPKEPKTKTAEVSSFNSNDSTKLNYAGCETLRLLLEKPYNRFELGHKIKSGYAPNEIKAIRDVLGHESIETVRETYIRRDGKKTSIGVYILHFKDEAIELLKRCHN